MDEPVRPATDSAAGAPASRQPQQGDTDVTPFDGVDVEQDVTPQTRAPEGETLTEEEVADIAGQVQQIEADNVSGAAEDQVSVAPEDVS